MGLGSILRTSLRWGLGAGAVTMYYQSGLWKNADETIKNYEGIKREADGFVNSVPVVRDLVSDVGSFASNLVSPATTAVSNFYRDWLSFDWSWTRNKDGIIKPTWNKAVAVTCDFMAHSPQTLKEVTVAGYTKASEYMNSAPVYTTTTVTPSSSVEKSEPTGTTSSTPSEKH